MPAESLSTFPIDSHMSVYFYSVRIAHIRSISIYTEPKTIWLNLYMTEQPQIYLYVYNFFVNFTQNEKIHANETKRIEQNNFSHATADRWCYYYYYRMRQCFWLKCRRSVEPWTYVNVLIARTKNIYTVFSNVSAKIGHTHTQPIHLRFAINSIGEILQNSHVKAIK